MSKLLVLSLGLMLSLSAFAQESLQGFTSRFSLVRNPEGKVTVIKLKRAVSHFSIKPFLDQIKSDLINEQKSYNALTDTDKVEEIDRLMADMGFDPDAKGQGSEEAKRIREALLNIPNINVAQTFAQLDKKGFWKEFERRLKQAFLFIDPTVMANLQDSRFFYKKLVTYKVVEWALKEAQKHFGQVPVLNIASFVIVRVHDMMLEQRHFHHNMLLHYFENVPESQLGMTKEEVDRAVSSIYEYRIEATNIFESNRAARDWLNYGMDNFYRMVRAGNARIRGWESPMSSMKFEDIKKVNFAFAEVSQRNVRKIYHLHYSAHKFTTKPSLAFDYSKPNRVRRNRALLNLAGVALGFINMPGWIKGNIHSFLHSFYVQQVRMEGALVGYFETSGNRSMTDRIYAQRANFYILR